MKKYGLCTLFPLVLLMAACSRDDGSQPSGECVVNSEKVLSFKDNEGDAAFPFLDFSDISVTLNNCVLKVELSMLAPPSDLVYDSANIADETLEYRWEVMFDVDRDGTASNNIRLAVAHFKSPNAAQKQAGALGFTQNNVWRVSNDANSSTYEGDVAASLDGTKLTMIFNISDSALLDEITRTTPMKFEAYYNATDTIYKDIYPNNGGYVN